MSRRKQAKPRAFLKLGETEGEEQEELTQPLVDLIDPKEEILSDNAENCLDDELEDDEDECQPQQPNAAAEQQKQYLDSTKSKPDATTSNTIIMTKSSTAATKSHNNNNNNNNNTIIAAHHVNALDPVSTLVEDDGVEDPEMTNFGRQEAVEEEEEEGESAGGLDPNTEHLTEFDVQNLADVIEDGVDDGNEDEVGEVQDDDDVDEEEDEEEDLDIHSLDSFYSDMYSTHTSSSYSPSISDGTMTPNSLHMHQHQHQFHHHHPHLPPHQQQQLQQLQGVSNDDEGLGRASRRRRVDNASGELTVVGADDDDDGNMTDDAAEKKFEDTRLNGGGAALSATEQQQRSRLGRCHAGIKMPTKLRKIDRDAAKFDKMTGDGIKSNSAAADGSYQCQFCDKSFPRLGYLKKHEQSHAEHLPFKCDYCARLFKHKRSRDRHTKLHTGDRRYRCPHCEAAFSRSDHLKIHMKTHDNQKPFQCTICNRGYNTAAALTSHMQNHKKQAAILAAGGNPQALNYSPRSTGSASSNSSLHKRRYAIASIASDSSPSRLEYPKRLRSTFLTCTYCTKNDFISMEQLNAHIQSMHDKELVSLAAPAPAASDAPSFQLSCEYCTMKFPNIPSMFQHMRTTHVDRLTSPNSYFEHFNRLAATGTFSPRLLASSKTSLQRAGAASAEEHSIKLEQNLSPKSSQEAKEEEPTDLSQNKRRSLTPVSPPQQHQTQHQSSPRTPEKPDVFFCNQCNAGLPDFESFRNHLKSHLAQGMNMVCHHCGLTLREQAEYERHVISHFLISNSEFNCTAANCQKSFVKAEELQKHLQDSHVATWYKCALCSELFDTKVAIQVHFACVHSSETKILRCSACMEVFRTNQDFNIHVKTRHQAVNGSSSSSSTQQNSLQCMFCRTVCSSDLEMHFHLAAHARQFRCPSCPETFHVEFLLDRHMQSHHAGNEGGSLLPPNKDNYSEPSVASVALNNNNHMNPMNSIYVNALFGKSALMPLAAQNNNNSILDYNVAFAAHFNKGLFPTAAVSAANAAGKFYSPLQVDTGSMKHPTLMYGLGQRYFDTNRTLIDMYNQHQQDKAAFPNSNNFFMGPKQAVQSQHQEHTTPSTPRKTPTSPTGFSCGMCERNDFRTETDLLSHRKIVHNMKTGVSLRCAYCSGNFKSRSELEHHMKTCHNSTGKHKCLICDEIFPSPAILAEHKLQHSKVGQSGKCSHCAKPLQDVAAFKEHLPEHNTEGQMPVQCICCRQSLHSDFEIGLHAKFHIKSANAPEAVCALCLESIPNAPSETKVCEKCCRKHNLNNKFHKQRETYERLTTPIATTTAAANEPPRHYIENSCNLCKMVLPHSQKLQEHLVEHTFAGCEERGFICYICSAVFTAPSGLLNHMTEHGLNARPYDCNLCTEKYYFRAELDHHLIDHDLKKTLRQAIDIKRQKTPDRRRDKSCETRESAQNNAEVPIPATTTTTAATAITTVKKEILEERNKNETGEEEDEYIEVEKVPELAQTRSSNQTEEAEAGQKSEPEQPTDKD